MNKAIYPFLFSTLLLGSCVQDAVIEQPVARDETMQQRRDQDMQALQDYGQNYADGKHDNLYQATLPTDSADLKQPGLSTRVFITYPELRQWPKLDAELRRVLDAREGLYRIDGSEQILSLKMLNERLLHVEATPEVKEAIGYYARKLVENKTMHWRILATSLLALDGTWPDETLRTATVYVADNVPGYIEAQKELRRESEEKLRRFEERGLERAAQSMTMNIGIKDRNIREARQALRDLETLSIWAAR